MEDFVVLLYKTIGIKKGEKVAVETISRLELHSLIELLIKKEIITEKDFKALVLEQARQTLEDLENEHT